MRQSKHAPKEQQAAYAEAHSRVSAAAARAAKLNDTVYTERVPPLAALPSIEPKSIVKPMAVGELQSTVSGASDEGSDLFARLVPLTVLQEASVYTAQRDYILREIGELQQTCAGRSRSHERYVVTSATSVTAVTASVRWPLAIPRPLHCRFALPTHFLPRDHETKAQ